MRRSLAKLFVAVLPLVIGAPLQIHAGTIAVLAARDREVEALKQQFDLVGQSLELEGRPVYQARFRGHPVLLAKTGANPDAVAPMIRWLVEDRHVQTVISVGPAGALVDRIAIGDVVVAHNAVRDLVPRSGVVWPAAQFTNCETKPVGTVVTVAAFVADGTERSRLHATYDAELVDMSAAVIAEVCASHHVPCVIIRQITDRADVDAPRAFAESVHERHPPSVPAAICVLGQLILGLAGGGPS